MLLPPSTRQQPARVVCHSNTVAAAAADVATAAGAVAAAADGDAKETCQFR